DSEIIIVGGGVGGLVLGLALHARGIECRIYEAAAEIKPLGVGINLLPHSMKHLRALGVEAAIAACGVRTLDAGFYNRFGQHIYTEPLGTDAGYDWPQYSIHRGDLHMVLLAAARERLGDRVQLGWRCTGVTDEAAGAVAHFESSDGGAKLPSQRGRAVIACDGIHSAIRKQFYPNEGDPLYTGVNMWRGVTRWKPMLSGATFVRAGWLNPAKLVIYPIRNNIDSEGRQLINWLVEVETPVYKAKRDWTRPGRFEDFMPIIADWKWDWLDVPAFYGAADVVLEYPMVDQEPLDRWTFGHVTLLGDAAHPMVPRGSNGAGQSILDAMVLADEFVGVYKNGADMQQALKGYEAKRCPATANVVRENRKNPPDAILREVYERTGDTPFARIEDVVTRKELVAITDRYKKIAGYDKETLQGVRAAA
ncbi:MAG: flavin-dependent oxidoreductase, partial [Burkholderiales bacterium]